LRVGIHFTKSEEAIGDEANLATGWGGNQANVAAVVAKGAGDGNTADGSHLGKRIYQTLILALLEGRCRGNFHIFLSLLLYMRIQRVKLRRVFYPFHRSLLVLAPVAGVWPFSEVSPARATDD